VSHQGEKAAQLGRPVDVVVQPALGQDDLGVAQRLGRLAVQQQRRSQF
jgi:hypothetical protein